MSFLPVTLPTAAFVPAFVAKALFCYRAKHILENLAHMQKHYSEQRQKHWTHETAYISLLTFLSFTILINHPLVRYLNTARALSMIKRILFSSVLPYQG